MEEATEPTILIEFQEILATILGIERNVGTGRYPPREPENDFAIPIASQIRLGMLAAAKAHQVAAIVTNSDGDLSRRQRLLNLMPFGATERVIDPGFQIVATRLSEDGLLSEQCREAINRWYGRK